MPRKKKRPNRSMCKDQKTDSRVISTSKNSEEVIPKRDFAESFKLADGKVVICFIF